MTTNDGSASPVDTKPVVPTAVPQTVPNNPPVSSNPLPTDARSESTAKSSLDRKRKVTEPELKVTTIDPFYDLTLIIGAPSSSHGQQAAFRVNKGTLRHASEIWTKMLTGAWAESKQSEIEFPDDSPWAFELVLRIAHLQMDALPAVLDLAQMEELARLTDKYNLGKLVEVALASKQWLNNARSAWQKWPAEPSYQDWAVINHVFRSQDDYEYLVTRLAVEVQVDEKDVSYYYGSGETKTKLKSDLPDRILAQIHQVRTRILQKWLMLCSAAIDGAMHKKGVATLAPCGKATCKATKIGILVMGLQAAGLYPAPESAHTMYQSVIWYWKALKRIGTNFKPYMPCDGTKGYGRGNHQSSCTFEQCLGDFGLLTKAEATLKQHTHNEVLAHMLSDDL